jgi:hypothetical protein
MATWKQATEPLTKGQLARLRPLPPQSASPPERGNGVMNPPDISTGTDQPSFNVNLKCPLPLIQAQPDGLRQFYRNGLPQSRVVMPYQ